MAFPAHADELDDIIASGKLRCAVVLDFPPMGSRNAKNEPEGDAFVRFLLSPEIQIVLAKGAGAGPANKKVDLKPEERTGLPYGEDVKKLIAVDWETINANRDEWNKRWTREIER